MRERYLVSGSFICTIGLAILSMELYGLELLIRFESMDGYAVQFASRFKYLKEPCVCLAFLVCILIEIIGIWMIANGMREKRNKTDSSQEK